MLGKIHVESLTVVPFTVILANSNSTVLLSLVSVTTSPNTLGRDALNVTVLAVSVPAAGNGNGVRTVIINGMCIDTVIVIPPCHPRRPTTYVAVGVQVGVGADAPYPSSTSASVFHRIQPCAGVAGRCAVVPPGVPMSRVPGSGWQNADHRVILVESQQPNQGERRWSNTAWIFWNYYASLDGDVDFLRFLSQQQETETAYGR